MAFDISALIAPILTSLITGVGIYVAVTNRLSILETKMDALSAKVEKHNNLVERTYKLESEVATSFHRIDELREELHN